MTKERIEEIKQFLKKYDYITRVIQIKDKDDACEVHLPDGNIIYYELTPFGISVQKNISTPEFWSCETYARRIIIACDIIRRMRRMNMNSEIIEYINSQGDIVDGLSSILPDPSKEEQEKENLLGYLINSSLEDGFPPEYENHAESQGMSTSYRLAKSFF